MAASSDFASWRGLRINAHAPCQMRIVRGKAIDLAQLRYASDVVGHRIAPNRTACGLGGRLVLLRKRTSAPQANSSDRGAMLHHRRPGK